MTETDMTETETSLEDEIFEEARETLGSAAALPPAPAKRGVGWGVVMPLFLLAGIGGAVGGWALTQYVMPKYIALPQAETRAPAVEPVNLAPLTARIDSLEKKLAAQSSQMSFLSSEVKSGSARVTVGGVDETLDITPFMNRLDDMEARLAAAQESSPVSTEEGSALTAPSYLKAVEERLVTLEKSFSEIARLSRPAEESVNADMNSALDLLNSRVTQLETAVDETRALAATPTVVRETVLLPPFPRAALLEAMTNPQGAASQNWLNKTLKKHISVRNPQEVARASETLDTIEALIDSGDYAAALKLVEAMPSDVRSAANAWLRALKAELKTRP